MKKKLKKFFILLIIIAIIALVVFIFINRKKKVIINDYTTGELAMANSQNTQKVENASDRTFESEDVKATINKYVKIPTEEEAQKVNAGIMSAKREGISGTTIITMDSLAREVFDSYGKGDIFILDGDENTPLKQVYFGKIVNKYVNSNSELIVEVEDPAIDEIFDELQVNSEGLLTEDNVNRVQLEEGVSLRWVDSIDSEFEDIAYLKDNKNVITNLTEFNNGENIIGPVQKIDNFKIGSKRSFLFEFDFGAEYDVTTKKITSKKGSEWNSQVENHLNLNELEMTNSEKEVTSKKEVETVTDKVNKVITETETTAKKDSKDHYTVKEEILEVHCVGYEEAAKKLEESEGFKSWKDDRLNYENKISVGINGKIGFDELTTDFKMDYSLWDGFKDIDVSFLGSATAQVEIKGEANLEIGGKRTKVEIPNVAKIQGLNKKLLPIGYIDFAGATVPFEAAYSYIDNAVITAGIMVYMDFNGNINLSVQAKAAANYDFNFKAEIVKDGEYVNKLKCDDSLSADFEFAAMAKVTARADLFGLSAILSVANVSVAEIVVFDVYIDFEAQAQFKATASYGLKHDYTADDTQQTKKEDDGAKWTTNVSALATGFIGMYVDMGRIRINLKFTTLPETVYSKTKTFEFDKAYITQTIWEYGVADTKTGLDPNSSYNEVSAVTSKYEIYRDTDGSLLRKNRENDIIVKYNVEKFVVICGIDQTYIYLLQGSNSNYSIYRLKIEGGDIDPDKTESIPVLKSTVSDMKIADNVGDVFLQDEKYIYFSEADDETTLKKVRKADRKVSTVCTFDGQKVLQVIDESDANRLYVAVIDNSRLAMILGAEPEAYFINKNYSIDGTNYTYKDPAPAAYAIETEAGYKRVARYVGRTFLRNMVEGVDIIAKNGTTSEMKTSVGWNGGDIGEFVIHDEQNQDGDTVYDLGYYSAETGEFVKVVVVRNQYAVWTATVGKDGRIYYIDTEEDSDKKQLCSASSSGGGKRIEKIFAEGEFNVDMNNTGVADMNGTMIFYSFDDDKIQVQLRYDIQ